MKFSFILIAIIWCSLEGKAQQINIFKNNSMEDFKRKQMLNKLLRQMHPKINNDSSQIPQRAEDNRWLVKTPLTSIYIGNNGKGADIYMMKPYNMPCLVPDKTFTFNMPVAGNKKAEGFVSPFKEPEKEKEGEK